MPSMAAQRDYYDVLGVARDASPEQVKKAFRALARTLHPDVNPDDPAAADQFREVAEAYEILGDAELRARYDRFGHAGVQGRAGAADMGGLDDILGMFFGDGVFGARGPRGPEQGADATTAVTLTLREAAAGAHRDLEVEVIVACEGCDGSGSEPPHRPVPCAACGGSGVVRAVTQSVFGQVIREAPCAACRGRGATIEHPCALCSGRGKVPEQRTVGVGIPAGIDSGQRVRVVGQGHAGDPGAPNGDLYVLVQVEEDPVLKRDGVDLHCRVDLTAPQAMLGATVHIPTLEGTETIVLEPGVQPGERRTLRGKGMPVIGRDRRGDLHVVFAVHIPRKLDPAARRLVEELDRTVGEESYRTEEGIFRRIKRGITGD
jgi:molecular chaperone DnaJ